MFSGGIDSTYLTWKLLSEGKNVVLYHIILINRINRWQQEQKAQLKIVQQFKEEFPGQVEYRESTLDITNIKMAMDSDYFITLGTSYAVNCGIRTIYVGFLKDDMTPYTKDFYKLVDIFSESKVSLETPLIHLIKQDFINLLPNKYKTFSCRNPSNGKTCTCRTCRKINSLVK